MDEFRKIISRLEISNLKQYRESIIGGLILIAASFLFYKHIYLHNIEDLERWDLQTQVTIADINRISAEIKETQKIAERLKEALEKLDNIEMRYTTTQNQLPSDKQLSSILKGLVDDDVKSGIKFTSLRPLPMEPKGEYFKLPFQITMQSRFQSFGEYLERIEDMPRLINVENFRIEAIEDSHLPIEQTREKYLLSIQLFMNTYVLGGQ